MLTALEGAQAGLGDQFVAHVGTTMALASAMPPDWFPKTGTPTAAQIATFVMWLHVLTKELKQCHTIISRHHEERKQNKKK